MFLIIANFAQIQLKSITEIFLSRTMDHKHLISKMTAVTTRMGIMFSWITCDSLFISFSPLQEWSPSYPTDI